MRLYYSEVEENFPETNTAGSIRNSDSYSKVSRKKQRSLPGGRGGGEDTPKKIGWGSAACFLESVTTFTTKICDIPCTIYDLTKNSIPYE